MTKNDEKIFGKMLAKLERNVHIGEVIDEIKKGIKELSVLTDKTYYDEQNYAQISIYIATVLFVQEGLDISDWSVVEVPDWADEPYDEKSAWIFTLCNEKLKKDFDINVKPYSDDRVFELTEVYCLDWKHDQETYTFKTIKEAIDSEYGFFE